MPIPSAPDTQLLRQGLTQVGRMSKVYRFKFATNWNIANPTKALTQFSSKDFKNLSNLTKALNEQKGMLDELKKIKQTANTVKETTKQASTLKKVQDALLKDIPGTGDAVEKAGKAGKFFKFIPGILAVFGVILGSTALQLGKELSEQTVRQFETAGKEFDIQLRLIKKAFNDNKKLDAKIQKVEKAIKINNDSNSRIAKDFYSINVNTQNANKKSNDALYEARQGRQILEKKINDNTYEIRQGRKILEDKIAKINADIAKYLSTAGSNFQQKIEATVADVKKGLATAQTQIISQAKVIDNLQSITTGLQTKAIELPKAVDSKIADLKEFTIKLINGKTQPIETTVKEQQKAIEDTKKYGVTTTTLDGVTKSLNDTYQKSFEAQAAKFNDEQRKLQSQVGSITTVVQTIQTKSPAIETAKQIESIKSDISTTKTQIEKQQTDLETLKEKVKVQEKVNESAIPKLDSILNFLPLIPARAADAIKPSIPTPEAINRAVQTGNCQSLKNGCGKKANDDLAQTINNNTNNTSNDLANIIGAANAGANTAQIGLLNTILSRLGEQLPGGLSGTFGRLWQTLQVDRIINMFTLITVMHNAFMLSNNIAQTLFSVFDNIGQAVGFKWKNEKGEETGFGGIVSEWSVNFFKTIFGEENFTAMTQAYQKANRIYQSATNMLWAVQGMFDSMRSITELIAEHTGKIGNALKKAGAVYEDAYGWLSEKVTARTAIQKKWDNVQEGLQGVETVVSSLSQVTGEVVSIGDNFNQLKEQKDEFTKSITDSQKVTTDEVTATKESAKINQPISSSDVQKADN